MKKLIAIDLFSGPGGLSEGFHKSGYEIALSIEKDKFAHQTLTFRSFCRKIERDFGFEIIRKFYNECKDSDSFELDKLIKEFPALWDEASHECVCAVLGETDPALISEKITQATSKCNKWVLLGGPPCQAYSLIGRSRMKGFGAKFINDKRHTLYREYLRIVAIHLPPVFIMENVRGILTSQFNGGYIFNRITKDLEDPVSGFFGEEVARNRLKFKYKLYSITSGDQIKEFPQYPSFLVRSEEYGIPQNRHRVFIVGIREDLSVRVNPLEKSITSYTVGDVILDLPEVMPPFRGKTPSIYRLISSALTNDIRNWLITRFPDVVKEMDRSIERLNRDLQVGGTWINKKEDMDSLHLLHWYRSNAMDIVLNHESRSHMEMDLFRYFFSSCFARARQISPKLVDFPPHILPLHKNVDKLTGQAVFSDRFRVQIQNKQSSTITSHISKDGHYYIHPDPSQCRSLTVREAARLQTFPDDYFFCGPRTEQYRQVGNAVPPLLAHQIAESIKWQI
jgi:DNA (cytosine-5)-methyltransferase 1